MGEDVPGQAGVRPVLDGDGPEDVKVLAAKNCFWKLGPQEVKKVCEHYGVPLTHGVSFPEMLFEACCGFLPDEPWHENLRRVGLRLSDIDASLDFSGALFDLDDANQFMSIHDVDKVKTQQKAMQERTDSGTSFKRAYRELHEKVKTDKKWKPPDKKKMYLLPSTIPQKEAKKYIPPNTYIWRGLQRCEWCGHCRPYKRCKASWLQYGEAEALRVMIRMLWDQWLTLGGLDREYCPIENLWAEGS